MQKWEVAEGNLASPRGFRGAAVAAGIKKTHGELDLALLVCDAPATTAAGVFTTNLVAAAPVLVSRQNLVESRGRCRALLVNAGNANACTGRQGLQTARESARAVGQAVEPPARAGSGCFHGRYRRASRFGPAHQAAPWPGRKALHRERLGGGARDHDHRHIPQVLRPALGGGRKIRASGGNRQGLRHDSSAHGHHAFLPHHGRPDRPAHTPQPAARRRGRFLSTASPWTAILPRTTPCWPGRAAPPAPACVPAMQAGRGSWRG